MPPVPFKKDYFGRALIIGAVLEALMRGGLIYSERARVQANARVPDSVRMMYVSGTAVISFRLTPSGHLLSAHVTQSSGIGAINRAALKAVETASYPPFRKKMPKHDMTFNVHVHLSAHDS